MKYFFSIIAFAILFVAGCKTRKVTQGAAVTDSAVSKSPAVELKPVDTVALLQQKLADNINAPVNFSTFYGRAKASFHSAQASGNATVYIKMKKDSIIWVSVTGPLNIEGARVLITPDSVKIINKLEGFAQLSSIARLQEITRLPFSFNDLQNLIIGRPVLNATENAQYKVNNDSITITVADELLTYINAFTKSSLLLGQSNFKVLNSSAVTGANIYYNDYKPAGGMQFPVSRDIAVAGSMPSKLELNFREYTFNEPQSFVFTISKNYKIRYE